MCLAKMAYVYALLHICITISSNNSIIPTGFKFTELHALTLATSFYALLLADIGYSVCTHYTCMRA